jgi:hypothetical protein
MRPAHGIAALTLSAACLLPAPVRGQAAPPAGGRGAGAQRAGAPRPAGRGPAAACQVEGVWELVSVADSGRPREMPGYRQRKVVARGHFMWLGEPGRRDTVVARTAADSLRRYQMSGGSGTYTLAGNTYTELLDYFVDPAMRGQRFPALCRTEGDRWYHTYPPPTGASAANNDPPQTLEVWRRIR